MLLHPVAEGAIGSEYPHEVMHASIRLARVISVGVLAAGLLVLPLARAGAAPTSHASASGGAFISADPNPVFSESLMVSTTLTWDTGDGSLGQVWVTADGSEEVLFAAGAAGSSVAPWIMPGLVYLFRLYEGTGHSTVLGQVAVVRVPIRFPYLNASPNPVPAGTGLGTTTVTWNAAEAGFGQVWVSMNGGPEVLFAEGAFGTAEVAWILSGRIYTFRLYHGTRHSTLLAQMGVTRFSGRISTLTASPKPVPAGPGVGTTTITWDTGEDFQPGSIYVSMNGGEDVLFAYGPSGSQDAPWILSGSTYRFHLYRGAAYPQPEVTVTRVV